MTVKALIAKLKKLDPEMQVVFFGMDGDWETVSNATIAKEWKPKAVILKGLTVREHLRKHLARAS